MCAPICLNTCKLNTMHNTVHGNILYINRVTHAYYEDKSITIMYTTILVKKEFHNVQGQWYPGLCMCSIIFAEMYMTTLFLNLQNTTRTCELSLLFGHTLRHLQFETHVVMHLSQWRLQKHCQNINLSSLNAFALRRGGRWHSHWFISCYAQNTPTGN